MANFAYVAKSRTGKRVQGYHGGASSVEVVRHLQEQGYVVLQVSEDRPWAGAAADRRAGSRMPFARVGTRDLAVFTRQLSALLEAGIPLSRGLHGLAADTTQPVLARALENVAVRIESGETLSAALGAHPRVFNDMYVSMVRAAEQAGVLDEILVELADYLEEVDGVRMKVRSALSYPVFVLLFAMLATGFLLFKVVPTFAEIYSEMGQSLPGLTRGVLAASQAVTHNGALVLGLLAAVGLGVGAWVRTPRGRYLRDALVLRLPVFGPLVRQAAISRFARTLSVLLRSGVPILEALRLTSGVGGNAVLEQAIEDARGRITSGQGVTSAFRASGNLPQMVLQLMGTGEEAGDLDGMLAKAAQFYDRQIAATVSGLTALIEPLMIVIVGGAIGLIVISMFLPIFYLGDAVMRGVATF